MACSCVEPLPPLEAMESASAVFVGKVVSHGLYENDRDATWVTQFEVTTVWKGPPYETFYIQQSDGSTCEYGFREGEEYLVYADGGWWGTWGTSICSRTTRLTRAQEDLEALGAGQVPSPGTTSDRPAVLDLQDAAAFPVWAMALLSAAVVVASVLGCRYWLKRRRSY